MLDKKTTTTLYRWKQWCSKDFLKGIPHLGVPTLSTKNDTCRIQPSGGINTLQVCVHLHSLILLTADYAAYTLHVISTVQLH